MNVTGNLLSTDHDLFELAMPHQALLHSRLQDCVSAYASDKGDSKFRALDIGTGPLGKTAQHLLDADDRIDVVSIDVDHRSITQASKALAHYGNRVRFICGDALAVLSEDFAQEFDIVASAQMLHNLEPDIRTMLLHRIFKVMKNDSYFITADKIACEDPIETRRILETQIERFKIFGDRGRPDMEDEWTTHYRRDAEIMWPMSQYRLVMNAIGFFEPQLECRVELEGIITACKWP